MLGAEDGNINVIANTPQTPAEAWETLMAGNARFVDSNSSHPNQDAARRTSLLSTQHPFAVIFGCSDSRLAAEIIFDLGLGDAFVVRTAGHVIDNTVLGSLEYSVDYLNVPLIVVLGHDNCGAVTATQDARLPGTAEDVAAAIGDRHRALADAGFLRGAEEARTAGGIRPERHWHVATCAALVVLVGAAVTVLATA